MPYNAKSVHVFYVLLKGRVVVSYVDADTLVMYECDILQADGSCLPDNRYVYVTMTSSTRCYSSHVITWPSCLCHLVNGDVIRNKVYVITSQVHRGVGTEHVTDG